MCYRGFEKLPAKDTIRRHTVYHNSNRNIVNMDYSTEVKESISIRQTVITQEK
jgi:hypothetical protein